MSPKKVYFHIGHGKTGSSAIQALLAQNHDVLKLNGYLYPFHNSFKNAIKGFISSGNVNAAKDENWLINQVSSQIESNKGFHTYIFSSESLFSRISRLLESEHVRDGQWDAHILLAVRNPLDMISSHHQQAIKRGGYQDSLKTFIHQNSCKAAALQASARLIEKMDNCGIKYSIVNYSIEKLEISSCFAKIMGIHQILNVSHSESNKIVNRSLTATELSFIASINATFGKKVGARLSDKLVNELPDLRADKLFISQVDIDQIIEKNQAALEAINRKLDQRSRLSFEYLPTVQHDIFDSLDPRQIDLIRSMFERRRAKGRKRAQRVAEGQSSPTV